MKKGLILFIGLGLVLIVALVQAGMNEMRLYKEAYPDARIKCIDCHVDPATKKNGGNYELNDYGKAVIAAAKNGVTVETFKKVGRVEDFKKK